MIAPSTTLLPQSRNVLHGRGNLVHLLDALREEAARQVEGAFGSVSSKRLDHAAVPGFTRSAISRAAHGSETNPLFRLAGWLLVMKRLGMGREAALRWLEWLRQVIDLVWPPDEVPSLNDVLDRDAALDGEDELPRQRARAGDVEAARKLIEVNERQIAVKQEVVSVLRMAATVTVHF